MRYLDANGNLLGDGSDLPQGGRIALQTEIDTFNNDPLRVKEQKWGLVNEFKNSLTITLLNGHKFAANEKALLAMGFKVLNAVNQNSIPWVEDWGSFITSTIELQEVLNEADVLTQNFINTTFGV